MVENSGAGIPVQDLQRVFDPFYRVSRSEQAGSGLGLASVREIATRFGGRVTLTNADGQRVRFEYVHPQQFDDPIPAQARQDAVSTPR